MTSVSFDVPINDDNVLEGAETFNISIVPYLLPNGLIPDTLGTANVTITDSNGKCFMHLQRLKVNIYC